MRISDWSSDVCSSDLFALNLGKVLAAKHKDEEGNPAPLDHAFFDNALANRDSHSGFSIDDDGDIDLDDILSEVEIGRASCRDRVCRYVCNSVVAVSCKYEVIVKVLTGSTQFTNSLTI